MAPVLAIPACISVTSGPEGHNSTGVPDSDLDKDDKNALLYIVVTLLFYSMGIVVGIITYLKRERADIEEEKLFDMYLAMKEDHCSAVHRQEQVRQMARQLRKLERVKAARLKRERLTADSAPDTNESGASDVEMRAHTPNKGDHKKSKHVKLSDCVRTPSTKSRQESFGSESAEGTVLYPLVISTASMIVGSTTVLAPILHVPSSGEHPPAAVTRFGEHERRGALPMGRKALHELEHGQSRNPDTVCLVSGPVVSKPPNAEQNSVRSSSDVRGKSKIDS